MAQMESSLALCAHRVDHRPGPRGHRRGDAGTALRGRHFYINDKPTGAVVGQQPFGVVGPPARTTRPAPAEPAALDVTTLDQGDLRAADESRLPAHGVANDRRVCRVVTRRTLQSA